MSYPISLSKKKENSKYQIPVPRPPLYECHPLFTFKHFDYRNTKFRLPTINESDINVFFEQLSKLSSTKWKTILNEQSGQWHAHVIAWHKTDHKKGFSHLRPELQSHLAYQFKTFKKCRVVGFIDDNNIFNVVWIDHDHQIYLRK